jgi:hypothetical protein
VTEAQNERGELDKMANVLEESQIRSSMNMHMAFIVVFLHPYAIYTASIMNSIILKLLHIPMCEAESKVSSRMRQYR